MRDRRGGGDMQAEPSLERRDGQSGKNHRTPRLRASSPIIPAILISLMILCVVLYVRLDNDLPQGAPRKAKSLYSTAYFQDEVRCSLQGIAELTVTLQVDQPHYYLFIAGRVRPGRMDGVPSCGLARMSQRERKCSDVLYTFSRHRMLCFQHAAM